ncbi:MAG TPA: primosomal protein N' [Flavobacteriales bacterium]|nr:primosomal protein N' [Flavobacteriales bacterium]
MSEQTLFADVILPLYVPKTYTYRVPSGWEQYVAEGQRVVVQFGKTKLYTGLLKKVHTTPPQHYQAKYLENILDEKPIVTAHQLELWDWVVNYYMCYPGEVFNVALPGNLKLNSETKFFLNPEIELSDAGFNDNEQLLIDALEAKPGMTVIEIGELLKIKNVQPFLKKLVEKKLITSEEEIKFRYKPKVESYLQLNSIYATDEKLNELLTLLEKRAPKQVDALMAYLKVCQAEKGKFLSVKKENVAHLLSENDGGITALVKKEILLLDKRRVERNRGFTGKVNEFNQLNALQETALDEIKTAFEQHSITLLHGVTASGKTEVYFRLIKETIDKGQQVLFLLPEIAITAQMVDRLNNVFGNVVGVYHSRFNPNERVEVWMKTLAGPANGYKIIIGARSAVYLPFVNLGLVIVDEEHEQSFKQQQPSPRYNGRDVAIVLARQFNAKVLLGSATPSVETYSNAVNNKYGYVTMKKRFSDGDLSIIQMIDLKEERKKKTLHEDFSPQLIDAIAKTLADRQQVIVFQNRRGYTPLWICDDCGWVPECTNCNVSLTYHKYTHQLVCHYCNAKYAPNARCNSCGSNKLRMVGLGTEKIEESLKLFFPEAKVGRMDLDTTRSKDSYRQIIDEFEAGRMDILVGTQMITKGLDFSNVSLVAIPYADSILRFPEFRAFEKAFQLFTQVSGRAGRKGNKGKVIIQTNDPHHPVLELVKKHDFSTFYEGELPERKKYFYPPYSRIIEIELSHKDEDHLAKASKYLANILRDKLGKRLMGPEKPIVNRVMNMYLENIIIKIEKTEEFVEFKKFIAHTIDEFRAFSDYKNTRVIIDVDPL